MGSAVRGAAAAAPWTSQFNNGIWTKKSMIHLSDPPRSLLPCHHHMIITVPGWTNGVGTFLRSQLLPTYPCEGGTHQTSWGLYHTALHAHILPDYARAKIVAPDSPIEASSTCVTPSWQRPEDGQSKSHERLSQRYKSVISFSSRSVLVMSPANRRCYINSLILDELAIGFAFKSRGLRHSAHIADSELYKSTA